MRRASSSVRTSIRSLAAAAAATRCSASARAISPRLAFQSGSLIPTEKPFASLSISLLAEDADVEVGDAGAAGHGGERLPPRRLRARRAQARVRLGEAGGERRRVERRQGRVGGRLQDQRLWQRLDRERAQDRLGHLRLALGGGELALLPQPLDGGLDAVGLARLAQLRAPRDEVAQGPRVLLGPAGHVQQAAGRLEPREGEPRPGLDLPGDALGAGPQDVGGTFAGVGAGAPGPGPGQGLRERVAGLVPLRPRQVGGVRAVPREVEHRVGQDAGRAPLRLGRLLETGTLGRRGVGSLDDLDVAAHVEGFLGERERAGGGETERQNGGTDPAKGSDTRTS